MGAQDVVFRGHSSEDVPAVARSFDLTTLYCFVRLIIKSASSLLTSRGPGNRGWTLGRPQQAGFPYQMLLRGFRAATHLLPAVCHHPLSSFGSVQTVVQLAMR